MRRERCNDAHRGLERLTRCSGTVPRARRVEQQADAVGDALLRLAHEIAPGAGVDVERARRRPPHDATGIVTRDVVTQPVELEPGRPRLGHRWPDRRGPPPPAGEWGGRPPPPRGAPDLSPGGPLPSPLSPRGRGGPGGGPR